MSPESPQEPEHESILDHLHPMVREATKLAVGAVASSPEHLKAALNSSVGAIEVAKTAIAKAAGGAKHLVSPSFVAAEIERLFGGEKYDGD